MSADVCSPREGESIYIHLAKDGEASPVLTLRSRIQLDCDEKALRSFYEVLPFTTGGIFHTVSSGFNIGIEPPHLIFQDFLKDSERFQDGAGFKLRSQCKPGAVFMRTTHFIMFNYGKSQDHGVAMPHVLQILDEDLEKLEEMGKTLWENQNNALQKTAYTLTLSRERTFAVRTPCFEIPPDISLSPPVHEGVLKLVGLAREHWCSPPKDLVHYLQFGDHRRIEGTNGCIFPALVIFNGVIMSLSTFANSGPLDIVVKALNSGVHRQLLEKHAPGHEAAVAECLADFIKQFLSSLVQVNLAWIQCLPIQSLIDACRSYLTTLQAASSLEDIRVLTGAMCLLLIKIHGWILSFFPFHVGKEMTFDKYTDAAIRKNALKALLAMQAPASGRSMSTRGDKPMEG